MQRQKINKFHGKTISMVCICLMILLLYCDSTPGAARSFSDLPESNPYYPYVTYLVNKEIVSGYNDGTFRPQEGLTRAEAAALLVKSSGLKLQNPTIPSYNDVNSSHWAYSYIETATAAGMLKGYPGKLFYPDKKVSRAELSVMLLNLTKEPLPEIVLPEEVKDMTKNHWSAQYAAAALDAGLLTLAAENSFQPDAPASRAQTCRGLAIMLNIRPESREVSLNGTLVAVKGQVTLENAKQAEKIVHDPVACQAGDIIKTGTDSLAEIRFPDGSGFRLEPGTRIKITSARGQSTILRDGSSGSVVDLLEVELSEGSLLGVLASGYIYNYQDEQDNLSEGAAKESPASFRSKPEGEQSRLISAPLYASQSPLAETLKQQKQPWWNTSYQEKVRMKVDMPWGVTAVRGTFWMNEVKSNIQNANVVDGAVELSAAGKTVSVLPGQEVAINSSQSQPAAPAAISDEGKGKWAQAASWVAERSQAISLNAPVIVPPVPLAQQIAMGAGAIIPEVVSPPNPPILNQIMKSYYESQGLIPNLPSGGSRIGPDLMPPQYQSSNPRKDAGNVQWDRDITITFNENIQAGSKFTDITLKTGEQLISCSSSVSGNTLTVNPAISLYPASSFVLSLPPGAIQDVTGNETKDQILLNFTTMASWQSEDVCTDYYSGETCALQLDSNDAPHVVFNDTRYQDGALRYACKKDGQWMTETIEEGYNAGDYVDLKMKSGNIPCAAYISSSLSGWSDVKDAVKLAVRNGDKWEIETVDNAGPSYEHVSLALDAGGFPHLCYYHELGILNSPLKYTYRDVVGWHTEIVDPEANGRSTSLVLDRNGQPHISYSVWSKLKYAFKDTSGWHIEEIPTPYYGIHGRIAVDEQGQAHIAYYDRESEDLRYGFRDATGWHTEILESEGDVGEQACLRLDKAGHAYIAYADTTHKRLKVAYQDEAGWNFETVNDVDLGSSFDQAVSMVLDQAGQPHICFPSAGGYSNLKYTCRGSGTIVSQGPVIDKTEPVSGTAGVTPGQIIKLEFAERVWPASTFNEIKLLCGENAVAISCQVTDNILLITPASDLAYSSEFQLVVPAGAVKNNGGLELGSSFTLSFSTIAGDNNVWAFKNFGNTSLKEAVPDVYGNPHLVYKKVGSSNCLYHSWLDDLHWKSEKLPLVSEVAKIYPLPDQTLSLQLIYKDTGGQYHYLQKVAGEWQDEVLQEMQNVLALSVCLDQSGRVQLCYEEPTSGNVHYGCRATGGWHFEILGNAGHDPDMNNYYAQTTLALDSRDNPRILCFNTDGGSLQYFAREDAGWQSEIIDDMGWWNYPILWVMDSSDHLYVSYTRKSNVYGLRHAFQDSSGWHKETYYNRESGQPSWTPLKIVLGNDGNPGICIRTYSSSNAPMDLLYASRQDNGWKVETVDSCVGSGAFIDLSAAGNPLFAYTDGATKRLKYAQRKEDSWQMQTLEAGGDISAFLTGKQDQPHIFFQDENTELTKYCTHEGVFITEPLQVLNTSPEDGSSGLDPASVVIKVDFDENIAPGSSFSAILLTFADGNVVPVQCRYSEGSLSIEPRSALPGGQDFRVLIPAGALKNSLGDNSVEYSFSFATASLREWRNVTVDDLERYYDPEVYVNRDSNGALYYFTEDIISDNLISVWTGSSWQSRLLPDSYPWSRAEVDSSDGLSSALDKEGRLQVVYYANMKDRSSQLEYAVYDAAGWHQTTLKTWPCYNYHKTALALDSANQPHVVYMNPMIGMLQYMNRDEQGWHEGNLNYRLANNDDLSLAIDLQEQAHLSFSADGMLTHLYRRGGQWQSETITEGKCLAMVLDKSDQPRICYEGDEGLGYARRDLSSWQMESLEIEPEQASLWLDAEGNPSIAVYYEESELKGIKILYHEAGQWNTERVSILSKYLHDGKLILGYAGGFPVIAYVDNDGVHQAFLPEEETEQELMVKGTRHDNTADTGLEIISIAFNQEIWEGPSLNGVSLTAGGESIPLQTGISGQFLQIYPQTALEAGQTYTLTIPSGAVKTMEGKYLDQDYTCTFTHTANWRIETIDSEGNTGGFTCLLRDRQGGLQLAYYDFSRDLVRWAARDEQGWKAESLPDTGNKNGVIALQTDSQGRSYVFYPYGYSHRQGSDWIKESVSIDPDASAVINEGGFIGYCDGSGALQYRFQDAGGWHWETIDEDFSKDLSDETIFDKFMLRDKNGQLKVAYYNPWQRNLKYGWRDGDGWHTEVIDSILDSRGFRALSMAEDENTGILHVVYYDAYNGDLKYAMKEADGWHLQTIDTEGDVGAYTGLALDKSGYPHICYYDVTNKDLRYIYKDIYGWHSMAVEAEGDSGQYCSLVLDDADHPYISYYDAANEDLKLACVDKAAPKLLASNPGEGAAAAPNSVITLRFDDNLQAGEAYGDIRLSCNGQNSELEISINGNELLIALAQNLPENSCCELTVPAGSLCDGSGNLTEETYSIHFNIGRNWNIETVDQDGDVGRDLSLSMNKEGKPILSYRDEENKQLKTAHLSSSVWTKETVDVGGDAGAYSSIAVGTDSPIFISYHDNAGHSLKCARGQAGNWLIETVDAAGDTGYYTSCAYDSRGHAAISYYNNSDQDLKFACHTDAGWQVEIVDSQGNVGGHGSLAIDSADKTHISYYDADNGDLKYAFKENDGWQIETVDTAGDVGYYSSITVDTNGTVHISYYDADNGSLKYACKNQQGWQIEIVDDNPDTGYYTSIDIDPSGRPHISYYDGNWYQLKHAFKTGSGWTTEVVDASAMVGSYSSLAFDSQGNCWIGYYDGSNGDLKTAHLQL